jgi:hypothetical protein
MQFGHSPDIWRDFPALVPGVLYAERITADAKVSTDWPGTPRTAILTAAAPRFEATGP